MNQIAIHSSTSIANGSQSLGELYTRFERVRSLDCGRRSSAPTLRGLGGHAAMAILSQHHARRPLPKGARGGLVPGDRVVVLAPLRMERLVAEWATVSRKGPSSPRSIPTRPPTF